MVEHNFLLQLDSILYIFCIYEGRSVDYRRYGGVSWDQNFLNAPCIGNM